MRVGNTLRIDAIPAYYGPPARYVKVHPPATAALIQHQVTVMTRPPPYIALLSNAVGWLVLVCAAGTAWGQQVGSVPGPYLGVEGGGNWQDAQDWSQGGAVFDRLNFKSGWIAGLNGGYSFATGLRAELELDHRKNSLSHDAYAPAGGSSQANTAMVNLWYDLRRPSGMWSVVHPYIGGGLGAVRFAFHDATMAGLPVAGDQATEFAYQAGAGVGFDVSPHLTLALDYRRLWSNHAEYHDDPANLVPIPGTYERRYLAETAMLSLRYYFGSAPAPLVHASAPPPPPPAPAPAPPVAIAPPPCVPPAGFQVDANCRIIEQTVVVRAVDFQFGSAQLTVPAQQTLDELAQALKSQSALQLEVRGYTDSVGSDAVNLRLSQHRAEAVIRYLVDRGTAASRLSAHGYGKADPVANNDSAEGRAQNRRVSFHVSQVPDNVRVESRSATSESTQAAQEPVQPH